MTFTLSSVTFELDHFLSVSSVHIYDSSNDTNTTTIGWKMASQIRFVGLKWHFSTFFSRKVIIFWPSDLDLELWIIGWFLFECQMERIWKHMPMLWGCPTLPLFVDHTVVVYSRAYEYVSILFVLTWNYWAVIGKFSNFSQYILSTKHEFVFSCLLVSWCKSIICNVENEWWYTVYFYLHHSGQ